MIAPTTVEAIQSTLADVLRSRTEWDEQPDLFTIHSVDTTGARLVRVPVPGELWTTIGHPPTAVMALAATALQLPRHPDGTHLLVHPAAGPLIGAAFRYEAYALTSDSPHPAVQEAARRRDAGGSVPAFKDIPGRTEQRCITAVDLDGGRYMASSNRIDESKPDATEPKAAYVAFADPKRDQLTGKVVDATIRFLNAVKPLSMKGHAR